MGLGPQDLVNDLKLMELIFENLCVRDLRVYADALDGYVDIDLDVEKLENN